MDNLEELLKKIWKPEEVVRRLEDIKQNPDYEKHKEVLSDLFLNFGYYGRLDLACDSISLLVNEKYISTKIISELGEKLLKKKKYGEVVQLLQRSLELDIRSPSIYSDLVECYLNLGKESEANETLNKAIARNQADCNSFLQIYQFYIDNKENDKLIEILERARTHINTENWDKFAVQNTIDQLLVDIYYHIGNPASIMRALEIANDRDKHNRKEVSLLREKVISYLKIDVRDPNKVVRLNKDYIRKQKINFKLRKQMINLFMKGGHYEGASKCLNYTIILNYVHIKLMEIYKDYCHKNKVKNAKDISPDIAEAQKSNANDVITLMQCYMNAGKPQKAIDVIDSVEEYAVKNPKILFLLHMRNGDKESLNELMRKSEQDDNEGYHACIYLNHIMKINGSKNYRNEYFLKVMRKIQKNSEFDNLISDYKEATHKIKTISIDGLLYNEILIKESDSDFEKEIEINKRLHEIVGDCCVLPTPLDNFKIGSKYYYIMKREKGLTLSEVISEINLNKKGEGVLNESLDNLITCLQMEEEGINNLYINKVFRDDFKNVNFYLEKMIMKKNNDKILKIMAKIHVLMPNDLERYNFDKKLGAKVLKAELNESIINSARPLLDVLSSSKHWGYNNDSCSDNWMISSKGKIILLDTEDRGQIPYAVDLAHLLNFVSSEPFEKKLDLVNKYVGYINEVCAQHDLKEKRITDESQFMLEYCNGVIYRSIANYGYLFSKRMPHDSKQVAETGIEMIDYMQRNNMIKQEDLQDYMIIKDTLLKTIN